MDVSHSVTAEGLDKALSLLKSTGKYLDRGLDKKLRGLAMRVHAEVLTRSPVDTGAYRANWQAPVYENGLGLARAVIRNNLVYAAPVTYGCPEGQKPWPKAGPKTVANNGRIYSRQVSNGVVEPIFDDWADKALEEILDGLPE